MYKQTILHENSKEEDTNSTWISDYDTIIDYNIKCKIETNIFTKNLEHITILKKQHHFFTYLHDFTYHLFDFSRVIVHSWNYGLYAKFYVVQDTSQLLKMAIFFAWSSYTNNQSYNSATIYEDYCGTLYECDDYTKSEIHFYKEMLKIILEQKIFNKALFETIVNKIDILSTNI